MTFLRHASLPAFPLSTPRLAGGALYLLLTLSGLVGSWMILRGYGHLAFAALLLVPLVMIILLRWQRGLYALLAYVPVAGVVSLGLSPWQGWPLLNPVLYKDWFFVVPMYLGYLGFLVLRRERLPHLPTSVTLSLLALGLVVIAQMANPGVPNILTALIGAKVWLFYIPLYLLAYSLVTSSRDLWHLFRLLIVLAILPCAVGIAEYVLAQSLGYAATMNAIYGASAAQATQEYTSFQIGGGILSRIPSTFTFITQYFGFTLAMLVPCYVSWRSDPSIRWRKFARWVLLLVTVASFLSGARAAFVFVPLLLAFMYGLDRGFTGALRAALYICVSLSAMLSLARMTAKGMFEHVSELFLNYAVGPAYGGLYLAITSMPLGSGTGTNTGPARYAFIRPEFYLAIENYYAKAVYELGIPGLLVVLAVLAALVRLGLRNRRRLIGSPLRVPACALLAFILTMALNSFKGWLLDLDPINVYFWVFAGVLARLPALTDLPRVSTKSEPGMGEISCASST